MPSQIIKPMFFSPDIPFLFAFVRGRLWNLIKKLYLIYIRWRSHDVVAAPNIK